MDRLLFSIRISGLHPNLGAVVGNFLLSGQDADLVPTDPRITDTINFMLRPVDYVLAGQQPYKERGREWDVPPKRVTEKTTISRSGTMRLKGSKPSFMVRSNDRGYD